MPETYSPIMMEGATIQLWRKRMKPYRKTATIRAVQVNRPFVLQQESADAPINGRLSAKAGSYLALSPQGTFYAIPEDVFESTYEEVTDE